MPENNLKNKKVNQWVFAWAMGVVLLLITTAFAQMNGIHERIDKTNGIVVEMNGDIREMKANIEWIRGALQANIKE